MIALDLDGGSRGPDTVLEGLKLAIRRNDVSPDQVVVLGTAESLSLMKPKKFPRVQTVTCQDKIEMGEKPTLTTRKRNCSMVLGIQGVRHGNYRTFVSAGETAVLVSLSVMILGRLKRGVKPAIAVTLPNRRSGRCLLIDAGADLNTRPEDLVNNAIMGSVYTRMNWGLTDPRVRLLNVGEENSKGDTVLRQAFEALTAHQAVNFLGNMESHDSFNADLDIAVCGGFTGNMILKAAEGVASMILDLIREELHRYWLGSLLAGLFLWRPIRDLRRKVDYEQVGAGAILGVNGDVLKLHGRSGPNAIAVGLKTANENTGINQAIARIINGQ